MALAVKKKDGNLILSLEIGKIDFKTVVLVDADLFGEINALRQIIEDLVKHIEEHVAEEKKFGKSMAEEALEFIEAEREKKKEQVFGIFFNKETRNPWTHKIHEPGTSIRVNRETMLGWLEYRDDRAFNIYEL